jgi:uncharacterized protein YjdB
MNRIRLALFALLVVSIGACGGRSALKPLGDGGGTNNDVGAILDGKHDTAVPDVKADATTPADGVPDAVARDIAVPDRPLSDVAPDLANPDGPGAADARDAGPGIDTRADGGNDLGGDTAPTLSSIGVTPPSPTIVVGVPYTGLVVTALFSDGTSSDVTASSAFVSSDTTIVQVSGHTLSGLKAGSATITATYLGKTATATVTVSSSPLKSLSIDSVVPVPVGQFILVTATGVLADGTKVDVTAQATWVSSDTTLATVALDAVTGKEKITGIKAGTLTVSATVQGISASAAVTVTASPITRIDITPVQPILQRGVSQPFQATATFADGTTGDVTQQATWTTSAAAVATVTSGATGVVVKAVAVGTTTISATVGAIKGSTTVTVTAPTLLSIAVAPASWLPNVGGTQSFTATGTFSDNTTADLTVSATWSSSSPTSFSISNAAGQKGQATALAVGTGVVQASFAGVIGTAKVAVTSSPLAAIKVTPNPLAIVLGLKGSLLATGIYQNGTTQDITTQVAWTVADGTIAGVSNVAATAGQVSGVGIGTTTVTATLAGISGQTTVTVAQAKLISITVTPATANVTAGVTQPFTATGNYDNGATPDLTTQVAWTSSNIGVAQVSNAAGSNGVASSLVAGTATITATLTGVSGTATLTVGAPLLSSIMIAPTSASIQVGATQAFTVTAVYQNGTTAPVLGAWTSSNPSVATVLPATGRRTLATAVAAGSATITVTFQGQTDTALLTVTAVPTLVGLTVTPQNPATILVGATQQFQANAIMSDGSSTVVTGAATWTSSDATIASVSNGGGPGPGGGGRGLATGIGAGTATIKATYQGQTASATLSVRNPTPTGLIINPATTAIRVNGTQQFQALVTLDDGTTQTVTNAASWTTSDGTIASITTGGGPGGPGGGGRGLATGVAAGTVTITATDNGFTAKATLTVSAATPVDLVVTPAAPKIVVGTAQAFVATLVFDDNTTSVVTGQATWSSSDPTVATVTTAGGGPLGGGGGGVATAAGDGTTTITAKFDGLSGTAVLTVTDPPISFVQVTPTNPNIPVQGAVQFTATAVFTDNSTRNVTGQATWSASDSTVAVVANSGAAIGRATGLGAGTATITATYRGTSGSSLLTVAQSVLSIAVTPTNPTTVLGIPVLFSATATLSNSATLVVTGDSSWVSSDSTVATVNAAGGAVPEKAGTTTITATYLGVSGSSTLTVSPATLSSIGIAPNPVTMANGAALQLTATGTYSDSSTHDLTSVATWLSSTPGAASVSNANGSRGLLTATGSGTTSVTAVFQGVTSATDTVTVTP